MKFSKLLNTQKTVFTVPQLGQILAIEKVQILRNQLTRRKRQGLLQNIYHGIRALSHYSEKELANALKTPSYISLETVLYANAVVFQRYGSTIFSIADTTKSFKIHEIHYEYHKISSNILLNPQGITYQNGIAIASVERAICDRLYLSPWYYFDNLEHISRIKLFEIAEIYQNKRLILDLKQLQNGTPH